MTGHDDARTTGALRLAIYQQTAYLKFVKFCQNWVDFRKKVDRFRDILWSADFVGFSKNVLTDCGPFG